MKRRTSAIESMREMMVVCNGVDSLYRIPDRSTGSAPSQALIDCAVEVARIIFNAETDMSWSRLKRGIIEEMQWCSEDTVLHNMALLIENFSKWPHTTADACAIMDNASLAIDLVLAKHDGEIH